jgi:hypothetical protein
MTGTPSLSQRQITWAGWGFAIGSALFMAGVPLSLSTTLSPAVAGWTYFAGSVFFTTAATLQTLASRHPDDEATAPFAQWNNADRANLIAAAVQLVGTVEFNITTLRAALEAADRASYSAQSVWNPDAIGSILFLVSSAIALAPVVHQRRLSRVRDRAWMIAAVNMLGSILFGVSAIGAWTTSSGDLVSLWWANVGTFFGGVCFLVGAVLMLPWATTEPASEV